MYAGLFNADQSTHPQRKAYVHLIHGSLNVNGQTLNGSDALLIQDKNQLNFTNGIDAEVLVFDLAP